jgi:DnaJ like chaperone protein
MTGFSTFADMYRPVASRKPVMAKAAPGAEVEELALLHAFAALSAQLAAIDGVVKPAESLAFENLFVVSGAHAERMQYWFAKHAAERASLLQYARQVTALTVGQHGLRQDIFSRYVRIAMADGPLNAAEMEWLRAVGKAFELEKDYVRLRLEQCFTLAQSPYAVLGVKPVATDSELRAAYMALVHALHPDRYQAAGASAETVAMLGQQLAAVNAAYASVVKARQKKPVFAASRFWPKRERSAKPAAA